MNNYLCIPSNPFSCEFPFALFKSDMLEPNFIRLITILRWVESMLEAMFTPLNSSYLVSLISVIILEYMLFMLCSHVLLLIISLCKGFRILYVNSRILLSIKILFGGLYRILNLGDEMQKV